MRQSQELLRAVVGNRPTITVLDTPLGQGIG